MAYNNYQQGEKEEPASLGQEQQQGYDWQRQTAPAGRSDYNNMSGWQYQAGWNQQSYGGPNYMSNAAWQSWMTPPGHDMGGYYGNPASWTGRTDYDGGKGRKTQPMGQAGHHHHHHHHQHHHHQHQHQHQHHQHQHQHQHKKEAQHKDIINDYFSKRLLLKDYRKRDGNDDLYNNEEVQECVAEFVKMTMVVVDATKQGEECDRVEFAKECEIFSQKWVKYSFWINPRLLRTSMDKIMENKIKWVGEEAPPKPQGGKKGEKGGKGEFEGGKGGKGDRGDANRGEFQSGGGKGGKKGGKGERTNEVRLQVEFEIGVTGSKRQQAKKKKELDKKRREAEKVKAEEDAKQQAILDQQAAEEAARAEQQAAEEAAAAELTPKVEEPAEEPVPPQEEEEAQEEEPTEEKEE